MLVWAPPSLIKNAWRNVYLLPLCPDESGMKVALRSVSSAAKRIKLSQTTIPLYLLMLRYSFVWQYDTASEQRQVWETYII